MQITFFSNFLNHHQVPFCNEMYSYFGSDFTFVSTIELTNEMRLNGYIDYPNCPYILYSYLSDENFNKAILLGLKSDIVISGSSPEIFIKQRLKQNKHTFRYSERLLKQGEWRLFDPRVLFSLIRYHTKYRKKNVYMLCASAFTAKDLNLVFAYPQKKYKWGYFPEVQDIDIEQVIIQKPTACINLLWTARFIDWKHPELAVKLAFELKNRGYNFHLNMIGVGLMFDTIKNLIDKLNLCESITLLGSIPNSEVRNYMLKSNIFVFTSDRNEGWGAVLNEAMSCGCAVVASNTIGAVPYLIQHKKNGLIFKSNCIISLLEQSESLIKNQNLRERLSKNAYYTMTNEWNAKSATAKFIKLAKSILDGHEITFQDGTCSNAG